LELKPLFVIRVTMTVLRVRSVWVLLYLNTSDVQYGWHRLHLRSFRLHV